MVEGLISAIDHLLFPPGNLDAILPEHLAEVDHRYLCKDQTSVYLEKCLQVIEQQDYAREVV